VFENEYFEYQEHTFIKVDMCEWIVRGASKKLYYQFGTWGTIDRSKHFTDRYVTHDNFDAAANAVIQSME